MHWNPILIKEMRTRMRGKLAFFVLTTYVFVLSGVILLYFLGTRGAPPAVFNQAGFWLTFVLMIVQMVLICLVAPTFSASAISSEREQETFDLLVASLARPSTIVVGKVGAALSYLLVILLGSMPVVALAYSLGGVALRDLAISYLLMLVACIAFCSISFLWSCVIRRGVMAIMMSLVSVFFLVVVLPLLGLAFMGLTVNFGGGGGPSQTVVNIVFLMLRINPFASIAYLLIPGIPKPQGLWLSGIPFWVSQMLFYLTLTALSLFLSIKRLKRVRNWI
ncbi:MAG TPA: ABC transporter permease subunit [Blastocatellia bacterium]|nr:ABC transporter permease subunit [Blastocatellia bacterium]